ncbi:MAG TPA: TolC family protein [Pirellulales bacterium]|jgi:NodT family efflux transporter outer membrane factor (OMF) lipoprotein|nr:TolC family protein [Pirellulales bacterium]
MIPKLRPPSPGNSEPQNYNLPQNFNGTAPAENTGELSTTEFFNDPTLASLINQALVGNQQLKILNEDIAIANNEIWRRMGAYLPFVSLGAGASLTKYSANTIEGADNLQDITPQGGPFPSPYPDFMVAADVSWQIDIWRQLRNARDAQRLRYLGTTDGRNYTLTRLVAEIAENYYRLMSLDKRLENLDLIIRLQEQSLEIAQARKIAARGTELAVQRFIAEVRKNQSEKLIIYQDIIETENRINFLCGRYPQPVERVSAGFLNLQLHAIAVGLPAQLLQNRPDIRQAERELEAAGLDIRVARANFFPKPIISAGVGWEAFNPKYLFITPESLIYNVAGDLVAPLVNKRAIQADFMNANARQLQALYEYQRVILNAFTEVVNRVNKVQNYSISIAIKRQQVTALETSVEVASNLFQNARIEYIDVLFAQRDLFDARRVLIDTKNEQLSAIVNAYQALGGGWQVSPGQPVLPPGPGMPELLPFPTEPLPPPAAVEPLPPANMPPANMPPADLAPPMAPAMAAPAMAPPMPPANQ